MPPRHSHVIRLPHPQTVLGNPGLVPAQKTALLAEGALTLGKCSTASSETMVSPSPAQRDRDMLMLDRVIAARARLAKAAAPAQRVTPAKSIA